jgi:hypothetical protein
MSTNMQQRAVLVRSRRAPSRGFRAWLSAHAAAQVNTFTIETAHMLNRFAVQAERSFEHVDECARHAQRVRAHAALSPETRAARARRQIQHLEIALNLLEAKLQRRALPRAALRAMLRRR